MKNIWGYLLISGCSIVYANQASQLLQKGHLVFQAGNYWSKQGQSQHINIANLIGDDFTLNKGHASSGFAGLGYFIDGQSIKSAQLSYGLNVFYLPSVSVTGNVIQENLFENLSYHYSVTNTPIYAELRSSIPLKSDRVSFTTNIGVGVNFMKAGDFSENSLDGGITIPDHLFAGQTNTNLSATLGLGVQWNDVFGKVPLECGYRFFYLGSGHLKKNNSQVLNTLNTGSVYANAVLCGVRF